MTADLLVLSGTAASVALIHTVAGPDHYLPFIALKKANRWSWLQTILITLSCGLGHILSSLLIGGIGALLGAGLYKMQVVRDFQGNLSGWIYLLLGLAYLAWSINEARKGRKHKHFETDGESLTMYEHRHDGQPILPDQKFKIGAWGLFIIFVFGPCEALIPILGHPLAASSHLNYLFIAAVYGLTTMIFMLVMVILGSKVIEAEMFDFIDEHMHLIAAAILIVSAILILIV